MIKKITYLLCSFPIMTFAQSPGGVASPSVWYRADAMIYSDAGTTPSANNSPVYQWNDYLGSEWNLIQANSARRPIYSNQTTLANFNPTVTFTRANVQWMECDPGAGNEIINRSSGTFYSAGFMDIDYFGTNMGAGLLGFNSDMDNPGLHTSNNSMFNLLMYSENGANYTPVSTNAFVYKNSFIAGASWQNGASTTSPATYGATTVSLNGIKTFYSGDNFRNANTSNAWRDFRIGGDTDWGNHNGQLNEILIYQNILTVEEKNRLESYLAIKYGTTLEDNYVNSTNGIVWGFDASYQANIFGIAHDSTGALYQKQSRSENNNQKLIIGAGNSLFDTNAVNTNTITDGQFLLVGDNGLKQSLGIPLINPSAPGGETNYRFEAVWKAQNTNGTGQVTIAWPKGMSNFHLVQSNDEIFDHTDIFTSMVTEVTVNGIVYNTATVTLGDGQFFTFAGFGHAPGGVLNALSYWYRADKDAVNTGVGTDVTSWTDFFSGNILSQMGTNALPKYTAGSTDYFNFNPGLNFTSTTDQSIGNVSSRTVTGLDYDIFTFTKEGLTGPGNGRIFSSLADITKQTGDIDYWDGIGLNLNPERIERVNYATTQRYLNNPGGIVYSTETPSIMYNQFRGRVAAKGLNGALESNTNGTASFDIGFIDGGHVFGDPRFSNNGSDNRGFIGHIGETIIYGAGSLTAIERRRVDSYLAIKYGITLERVATDNYLASDAGIVWNGLNNTGYNNNIFGIANDALSALHQKQSKSVNANQKLIIGTGTSLADTNAANTNSLVPGQYVVVGDNGLKQSLGIPLINPSAPGGETNYRFEAVWKVQNTNGTGQVTIAWPKGMSNFHLVQSNDEIFDHTDIFTSMVTEVTVNGIVYNTATVTLGDGQFFTFAGFGHAPGGVLNALSYWYRADKDAVNTGVGTDVTSWTDFFSGTVVSQMTTNPLPKYVDGAANYFNYNPGINFTAREQSLGNTAVQTVSQLGFDIFTFTKEGITDNGGNPRIFSSLVDNTLPTGNISRWDGIGILSDNRLERVNNTYGARYLGNPGGAFSTTIPSIMYHKFTDLNLSKSLNGAADGPLGTHSARGLMNGGHAFGSTVFTPDNDSDNQGFIGHLGETIIYGAGNLTAEERRRVDSYMAIKYGITLGRVDTEHYLGSTASATSIVWSGTENTAYNNNIFGIARADIGGFEQKVSKSVNSGTILTIATIADFILPNSDASRTGFSDDESYFILGDNNDAATTPLTDITIGGDIAQRIPRIWLSQRTNTAGSLYFEADLSSYGGSFIDGNTVYMLVADDEAFTTNLIEVSGTYTFGKWVFNYDFDADEISRYITFAGVDTPLICTKPGAEGTSLTSSVGILTKPSATDGWPANVPNGYIVLDSSEKGFVITHMTTAQRDLLTPVEGMMIYNTTLSCVQLYRGTSPTVDSGRTGWNCIEQGCVD